MITVLRGTSKHLIHYTAWKYTTPNDFVILGSKDFALPFVIVRLVIPLLRKRLGNDIVEEMLRAYSVPFSLIFNKLAGALTGEERLEQELLGARLSSNITHSRVVKDAILQAYARVLVDLKDKYDFRLVIPDMTHIDTGSLDLLQYLYQVFPKKSPDLVIGYDPVWEKPVLDQDNGISWYYALEADIVLRSFVYAFEAVAAEKKDISDTNGGADYNTQHIEQDTLDERLDMLDDKLELDMDAATKTLPRQWDDANKHLVLEGIQRCFRLYDFTNTLLFGLRSLAMLEPLLNDKEKAAIYHMIALSAHNRHFFSQGNAALAGFINDALQKALLYETDPATRVAILYRLMVTQGRRKNDLDLAYVYLDQACSILIEANFSDKELLTAWVNNIHSFLLMKQGRLKEAIAVQERGFYLLDKCIVPSPAVIKTEIAFTKAVLAENLSTLNSLLGDVKQMKAWYAIESRLAKQWPSLHAVPSAEWQSFHYQNLELHKALEKTKQGLVTARKSFHYILEYFFTISAADIHYRLGNAADALEYFRKALLFQEQIGYEYASAHALRICLAKTKLRLDRVTDALADVAKMEKETGTETTMERIEICLLSAHGLSCQGIAGKVEAEVNTAIDLAVASGDCGALVKVMLSAGIICQQLNRKRNAMTAYRRALEMSKTILDGVAFQADTADLAAIYFGLYECNKKNTAYLDHAISNLSLSLKRDADSWWRLPHILAAFSGLPVLQRNNYLRKNKSIIDTIRKAAKQRSDCRAYLHALKITPLQQLTT